MYDPSQKIGNPNNQRGSQNPLIEEGQKTQWPKEKGQTTQWPKEKEGQKTQ
jgi:hypothetical protein